MASDFTDQVNIGNDVVESERLLRLITDAVPALISYVDLNRRYRYNNLAYQTWFGQDKQSVLGKHMSEVLGTLAYEKIKPFIDRAFAGEKVHVETLVPYRDGGDRYISGDYIPHFNDQQEVMGIYVVVNDVTESKRAEESIRRSEEKYRNLFESMDQGFCVVDFILDENGQPRDYLFVEANPVFEKQAGFKVILGKTALELLPNIEKKWIEIYGRVALTGEPVRFVEGSDLVGRYFEVYAFRIGDPGKLRVALLFTDISERNKSEKILKESEERFRSLASEAPIFVWLTDASLQTTYLNKVGMDYFSLVEDMRMEDLSWKKFIHPDDLERVLHIMRNAAEQHIPYTLEMRLRNGATNEYRWFLDKGSPRYIGETFTGFIGTSLDIHDRKLGEELLEQRVAERTQELAQKNAELQENKFFVETILDSSRDFIAVFDLELRYISVNKEVERLYNLKSEEVKGKFVLDVFPQMKDSPAFEMLKQCLRGETVYNKEIHSQINDHWFQIYYVPLKNIEGVIYGAVVIGHDITDILQASEEIKNKNKELENSRSFLQQIIDSSVEFIAVLDSDLHFIAVNKKFEEGMGLSRNDIYGRHLFAINPQVEGTLQHDSINQALEGKTIYLDKRRSVGKPNLFVDTYFIPFIQQNKIEGVIIMSRDVTDIVKSELDLEQKNTELERTINLLKKQELRDVQKNNFITMASHELKTPITSIKGYIQLLLSAAGKGPDTNLISPLLVRSSLTSVDKQITRLTRLISELLDLSKIESGTLELRQEKFSLNELAISTVEDILYTNSRHQINLYHDFHAMVEGDKDRIDQAIINLLTNAIKYSPNSDKIDVWIKPSGKSEVELTVRDYGIGIDKKYQDRIFERFYRAEGKEEQTYPGFGIGLFITKEIVERHGGRVWFESEKGKGSVFSIVLPVVKS